MRRLQQRVGFILLAALALLCPVRMECQQNSAQALDYQAGKSLDAGDVGSAIQLYRQVLQLEPDSIEARTNLGVALGREGHYDQAAQQYRLVLSRDPANQPALLNLALALYKQAEFSAARDDFKRLHAIAPANEQAIYLLADCDLRLEKYRETIALIEPLYEAHPEVQALEYLYGTALIKDGQTQKGAAVIDRIMRSGDAAVGDLLLSGAQYSAGDYKDAIATLRKALDLNANLPGAWTLYGQALLSNAENEQAKAAFQRAVEADPNDFSACLHLGATLRQDGDMTGAEKYLKHALALRPDSSAALFQMGTFELSSGHLEEAKGHLEKIVKQWPDFVDAHLQLAVVYARLHRPQDSERERRIVQTLNDKERAKGPRSQAIP